MMRVLLHEGAIRDIRDIAAQLSEDSTKALEQFYDQLDAAAEFVVRYPDVGHPCGIFRRWNFKRLPYHLLYEAHPDRGELWIMVVHHERRHPSYGMKRRLL